MAYIIVPASQGLFEGLWWVPGATVSDDDDQSADPGPGVSRIQDVRARGLQRIVGECTSLDIRQVLSCKFRKERLNWRESFSNIL